MQNVVLDFVIPAGVTGGEGPIGPQGFQGETGETGQEGPAVEVTVAEDTSSAYILNIVSENGTTTTPNLLATNSGATQFYSYRLEANSSVDVYVENIIYRFQNRAEGQGGYIYVLAADPATPILADIKLSVQYLSNVKGAWRDNTVISTPVLIDDGVYARSQEQNRLLIRQQNPLTNRWSLCAVNLFVSEFAARVSIWVEWIAVDVEYVAQ